MKVSIIIPTFNRAKYVCEAIDSALQQTMKDIEIIVVDDGSTDNTREKLKPYEDKIQYIHTQNGGPAHARNIGMKAASGEYVAFLDSDDLYYPYKIELQTRCLDKFPDISMVCTETSAFDDSGYWNEYHLKKYHKIAYERGDITYENIFSKNMLLKDAGLHFGNLENRRIYMGNIFDTYLQSLIVLTPTVMFRRTILDKIGMQNERYWIFEEYDFVLRISKHYKVAFIDVPTYKHRNHGNHISVAKNKDEAIHIVIIKQTNLLEILETYGLKDREYYLQHKNGMDKRIAVLHKALAIPLMAKGKQPKVARNHLKKCAFFGYPEHFLWSLTFAPYVLRRVVLKFLSLTKRP